MASIPRDEAHGPSKSVEDPSKRPITAFHPSFYTTISIFTSKGVAVINKCCLDSGYESAGPEGYINPSIVQAIGLPVHQVNEKTHNFDGTIAEISRATRAPVTFETATGAITIHCVLLMHGKDISANQIIFGTGMMHELGVVEDFRHRPSKCKVHDRTRHELVGLSRSTWDACVTYCPKSNYKPYIESIIQHSAFFRSGTNSDLPSIAYQGVGGPNAPEQLRKFQIRPEIWTAMLNAYSISPSESDKFAATVVERFRFWVSWADAGRKYDALLKDGLQDPERAAWAKVMQEYLRKNAEEKFPKLIPLNEEQKAARGNAKGDGRR